MNNKILIVEDEVMIAKNIEHAIIEEGFQSIGIAHDSEIALARISTHKPDFVILDINIDGHKDGIEVAEIINKNYKIPFIFLTALADLKTLERAKKVRPCGYIVKPFTTKNLMSTIAIGIYNFEYRNTTQTLTLENINSLSLSPLSKKEYEVLIDIKNGLTNAQIAKKQFLSLSTIKFHSQNIYSKLDVKNRTSAVKKILNI